MGLNSGEFMGGIHLSISGNVIKGQGTFYLAVEMTQKFSVEVQL